MSIYTGTICGRNYNINQGRVSKPPGEPQFGFYFGSCGDIGCDGLPTCNQMLLTQDQINNNVNYLSYCSIGGDPDDPCGVRNFGAQYRCKQVGWDTRNITSCCTGELNTSDGCDPTWCPGSELCASNLQTFCTTNNASNIETTQCQAICRNPATPEIQSWCDQASENYCTQPVNRGKPYCGCINSQNGTRLACFDPNCTSLGYRTRTVASDLVTCSAGGITICQQAITCQNSGTCTIDQNKFDITCPNDGKSVPSTINNINLNYFAIGAIIIVIIILIIILMIYFFSKK